MHVFRLIAVGIVLLTVMASNVLKKSLKKSLCGYSFNATGLRTKLDDFNSHFTAKDYDFISITETWLNDNIMDCEILKELDYVTYRRDRDASISTKKDSDCTMCSVRNYLTSKRRRDLETPMEILWIEVLLSKFQSVFVGTVYIAPDTMMDM